MMMHEPDPGPRRMLYRSSANIALLLEENRRLRAALEAALWYCEDIEMLKDARAMTTQYAWVRHRAPYPVAQIRAALAAAAPKAPARCEHCGLRHGDDEECPPMRHWAEAPASDADTLTEQILDLLTGVDDLYVMRNDVRALLSCAPRAESNKP